MEASVFCAIVLTISFDVQCISWRKNIPDHAALIDDAVLDGCRAQRDILWFLYGRLMRSVILWHLLSDDTLINARTHSLTISANSSFIYLNVTICIDNRGFRDCFNTSRKINNGRDRFFSVFFFFFLLSEIVKCCRIISRHFFGIIAGFWYIYIYIYIQMFSMW